MKINYNGMYDVMKANPDKDFEDFYQEFATAYQDAKARIEAEEAQLEIKKKKQAHIEEAKTALIEAQLAYEIAIGRIKPDEDLDKVRDSIKTAIEITDKVDLKFKSKTHSLNDSAYDEIFKKIFG